MTTNPSNPLVAPRIEAPKDNLAGYGLSRTSISSSRASSNGSWIDGTLGVVGAAWTRLCWSPIPPVRCCSTASPGSSNTSSRSPHALDWLAGDPGRSPDTPRHGATSPKLCTSHHRPDPATTAGRGPNWQGLAADAYRAWAGEQREPRSRASPKRPNSWLSSRRQPGSSSPQCASWSATPSRPSFPAWSCTPSNCSPLWARPPHWSSSRSPPSWPLGASIARWLRALLTACAVAPALRRAGQIAQELKQILTRLRGRRSEGLPSRHGPPEKDWRSPGLRPPGTLRPDRR